MADANTIEYWWDSYGQPDNPGWYAREMTPDNECADDSMKIWFPVPVDDYAEEDRQQLHVALQAAYPDHYIVWLDDQ